MSTEIPFIRGASRYEVNVAGESFYPESFAALCGLHSAEGVEVRLLARLELQDDNAHDPKAVRVTISGHPVGHLSREHARAFRRSVRYGDLSMYETFECAAIIRGGWVNESGKGNFGVRLDLLLDE